MVRPTTGSIMNHKLWTKREIDVAAGYPGGWFEQIGNQLSYEYGGCR